MHLLDSVFIFVLALVLFGPKKLPEIARQMGKLLAEFRRASNEFKMQMDEELRSMEQQQQQEQQNRQKQQLAEAGTPSQVPSPDGTSMLEILPPNEGEQVPIASPYAEAMAAEEEAAAEGAVLEKAELENGVPEDMESYAPDFEHTGQFEETEETEERTGDFEDAGKTEEPIGRFEDHSIGHSLRPEAAPQPEAQPESEQAPIHHG